MDHLYCGREILFKILFLILFQSNVRTQHLSLNEILRPQLQCAESMTGVPRIHGHYMNGFSKEHDQCITDFSGLYDQYILDECFKDNDTKSNDYFSISEFIRKNKRRRSQQHIKRSETTNMSYFQRDFFYSNLTNKMRTDQNVSYNSAYMTDTCLNSNAIFHSLHGKFWMTFEVAFVRKYLTLDSSKFPDFDTHGLSYPRFQGIVQNDTLQLTDGEFTEFAKCSNVSIQSEILLSTLIPAVVFTTLAVSTYILLRCRRRKLKMKNKKERMYLIRENARDAKYRVFISYNSKDYDFLMQYVYDPLEQNLRQKTGTEANILCLGDRDFRLGKPVADEIIRCLEESAVFLILLSHNYYHNKYSMMEFEHALRMDKQMIIMVKDEVNENEMTPSLRSYFRNNTRVLWKRRGNQYQLSTTWNNICASIQEVTGALGDPNNV